MLLTFNPKDWHIVIACISMPSPARPDHRMRVIAYKDDRHIFYSPTSFRENKNLN